MTFDLFKLPQFDNSYLSHIISLRRGTSHSILSADKRCPRLAKATLSCANSWGLKGLGRNEGMWCPADDSWQLKEVKMDFSKSSVGLCYTIHVFVTCLHLKRISIYLRLRGANHVPNQQSKWELVALFLRYVYDRIWPTVADLQSFWTSKNVTRREFPQ